MSSEPWPVSEDWSVQGPVFGRRNPVSMTSSPVDRPNCPDLSSKPPALTDVSGPTSYLCTRFIHPVRTGYIADKPDRRHR